MVERRFWTLAAGTVACAIAIGFVMQTYLVDPAEPATARPPGLTKSALFIQRTGPLAAKVDEHRPKPIFQASVQTSAPQPPDLPEARPDALPAMETATPRDLADPEAGAGFLADVVARAATEPGLSATAPFPVAEKSPTGDQTLGACAMTATVRPAGRAMVAVSVDVPCQPDADLIVHHAGLSFTARTDASGHVDTTVPAMSDPAVILITAGDRTGASVRQPVPDLDDWHRVALQWTGPAGFEIHAREYGADYDGSGHVWSGAPDNSSHGGFLVRLGQGSGRAARWLEVYSLPRGAGMDPGTVALSVETEVTMGNCGTEATAQIVERPAGQAAFSRDLVLQIPTCSAIGNYLVLNNLLDDLTIAAN
ncbi:MAG: hypothetical protein ACWA5A_12240 [Marinibacterium sp.]